MNLSARLCSHVSVFASKCDLVVRENVIILAENFVAGDLWFRDHVL